MAWQIKALRLPVPEREFRFAPPRRWRFDFSWAAHALALEVEGGTFSVGRHTRGTGYEKDCEKYAEALVRGWRVLRVTGSMVQDGRAVRYLERLMGNPLTRDVPHGKPMKGMVTKGKA